MISHNDIIKKLKTGWALYSRGEGFWLRDGEVKRPYTREIFIPDRVVNDLKNDNIITLNASSNTEYVRACLNKHFA